MRWKNRICLGPGSSVTKGISQVKASHARPVRRAVFDEPNLLAAAGLVPVVALADRVGLQELADQFLTIPTDKGANAGLKVTSLVAGMVAGADSIDDMAILRHGGMRRVFDACYAPSTLGSFLRSFRFGHVRQLDAVAARTLIGLGQQVPLLPGIDDYALADMDDSIIEVHGYAKQGAGFGYTQVRGLNSFIGTVSTPRAAPVIVAQRLRKGSCGSARGAGRLVADTLATVKRLRPAGADRSGAAAGGFGVLRPQGPGRGPPREGGRVDHGAADQAHQGRDRRDPR